MTAPRPSGQHSRPMSRPRYLSVERNPLTLAALRLAQLYLVTQPRGAMALYRKSCERVAQGNEVLRSFGLIALITEQMAQIEASLASDVVPDLRTAIHEAEVADCQEELSDEALRKAEEDGTLTVEIARAAIRASAAKRHRAEVKERALHEWIAEQKTRE